MYHLNEQNHSRKENDSHIREQVKDEIQGAQVSGEGTTFPMVNQFSFSSFFYLIFFFFGCAGLYRCEWAFSSFGEYGFPFCCGAWALGMQAQ